MVVLLINANLKAAETADGKAIQGNWKVVKIVLGEVETDVPGSDQRWIIAADKITMKFDNRANTSTFSLDSTKDPKEIDLAEQKGTTILKTRAIYELNGDDLRICITPGDGATRPKSFKPSKNEIISIIVLKREKA